MRKNTAETGTTTVTAELLWALHQDTWAAILFFSFKMATESRFFAAGSSESESSASEDEQPVAPKPTAITAK